MEGSAALAAMKAHVERIRAAMEEIIVQLYQPNPNWKELLGHYSALSARFHILLEELNRKDSIMFPSLAIHPKKTIPENIHQIPLLLRSKTLPELEEREKKLTQEYLTSHDITTKTEEQNVELETRIGGFNAMCEELVEYFDKSKANYVYKTKREDIQSEDNTLHLNTIIEAIMTGKGVGGEATAQALASGTLGLNVRPAASQSPFGASTSSLSQGMTAHTGPYLGASPVPGQTNPQLMSRMMRPPGPAPPSLPAVATNTYQPLAGGQRPPGSAQPQYPSVNMPPAQPQMQYYQQPF